MKNWPPRLFFGWFFGNTFFFQSKVGKTENFVTSERAYIILEIMSIQGYKMWTNWIEHPRKSLQPMTFECKNNIIWKYHSSKLFLTLDLDVVNINRNGSSLGVIPLVCINGLLNMKMGNLFHKLLATPIITTIKIVHPLAPQSQG